MKFRGYEVLKANLHCHYVQMHLANPLPVIKSYKKAGFDCIALTEHANQTDTSIERVFAEKVKEKYGDKFFVIPGKENTARTLIKGRYLTNDIVSLFINSDVSSYEENGNIKSHRQQIEEIHKAGGIAIIAHEHSSQPSSDISMTLWNYRKGIDIDGWEIGSGLGLLECREGKNTFLHRHPEDVVKEGYIAVSGSDSHADFQAFSLGEASHTYIFAKERSLEGIKDALLNRQTVAYANGFVWGEKRWIEFYRDWRWKEYEIIKKDKKKIEMSPVPTVGRMFFIKGEEDRLDFLQKLKRYYQTGVLSEEYYQGEHRLLSLFFIVSSYSDNIRTLLSESANWLSYRYYWVSEYRFQYYKKKKLVYMLGQERKMGKNPEYWVEIARLNYLIQEHKKALHLYQKAEKLGADSEDFFVGYCQLLFRDDPYKALSICLKGLKRFPSNLYLKAQTGILERIVRSII